MKRYVVFGCHSSSLVHNQTHMRLHSTPGLHIPSADPFKRIRHNVHTQINNTVGSTAFNLMNESYTAHLHLPSSTKSYSAPKGPMQEGAGCCCRNNLSAHSNLASAPRYGSRRVPSSSELLTICSHLTFSGHCGPSLFTCRGVVLSGKRDRLPNILAAGYRKSYVVPQGTGS